jgi:hypothetical protein
MNNWRGDTLWQNASAVSVNYQTLNASSTVTSGPANSDSVNPNSSWISDTLPDSFNFFSSALYASRNSSSPGLKAAEPYPACFLPSITDISKSSTLSIPGSSALSSKACRKSDWRFFYSGGISLKATDYASAYLVKLGSLILFSVKIYYLAAVLALLYLLIRAIKGKLLN